DASFTRGEPLLFRLGAHQVIDGWEEAFSIFSVGDKATLVIPAHLGYGPRGSRGIPPNADLIFEVELVEITDIPPAEPYDIRGTELLEMPSGLKYYLVKETSGRQATNGDTVQFHYTGYLEDGSKFDSTFDRGQPVIFKLGSGQLLPGWDEGMMLLKEGEKARLMIPPVLAFGPAGLPPTIPANATLIMDVEVLSVY
ncbi:MAG: FKBP-type peptidyl-prolyl cis-trans isomerase, partial [Bacteroidota bacterium]